MNTSQSLLLTPRPTYRLLDGTGRWRLLSFLRWLLDHLLAAICGPGEGGGGMREEVQFLAAEM